MVRSKIAFKIVPVPVSPSGAKKKSSKRVSTLPSPDSFELLHGIFEDAVGEAFQKFLVWCQKQTQGTNAEEGLKLYRRLWRTVSESTELLKHPTVGNGFQDHLLERFLDDPNVLHRKAELVPFAQLGKALKEAYEDELEKFLLLLHADLETPLKITTVHPSSFTLPSMEGLKPLEPSPSEVEISRFKMKEKIFKTGGNVSSMLTEICSHFLENGFGLFGHYRVFRWDSKHKTLEGIEKPDLIRLRNLVGYDETRRPLLENIEAFVSGSPANNVLIYGERGTGKSSTVKALFNEYQKYGLRLVEISSQDLSDYPLLLKELRGRREKFVIFVDDLSFEETETRYKGLKSLLEGTVEATPSNIILFATSNRRHLVREFFSEREEGKREVGEVHGQDTVEEKLSLSDRFGLVVSFYTPNQETYLKIVDQWAKVMRIRMPAEELHARAILWARRNNGPSGRTAKQFVNNLKGRIKMETFHAG